MNNGTKLSTNIKQIGEIFMIKPKKNVFVLIGPSGSGKSTFTKKIPEAVVFSWDQLRLAWYGSHPSSLQEQYRSAFEASTKDKEFSNKANAAFTKLIKECEGKKDIIVDNTNLSTKRRRFFVDMARQHGYRVTAVLFPVSVDVLKRRNESRPDKHLPPEVIDQQYKSLQQPLKGEFDVILHSVINLDCA